MQNCFIVAALQHGRRENPLYTVQIPAWYATATCLRCQRNIANIQSFFSLLFLQSQNELPDVQYLAVSENGLKLLKREKITDELEIVQSYPLVLF